MPEAVGLPPSATNRLAGLRAFCLSVCVSVCWCCCVRPPLLSVMKGKCCFSNLFVLMYCMCFPAGVEDETWDEATHTV